VTKSPGPLEIHGSCGEHPDVSRKLAIVYARILERTNGHREGAPVSPPASLPEAAAPVEAEELVTPSGRSGQVRSENQPLTGIWNEETMT
jgi:hypothetical protein